MKHFFLILLASLIPYLSSAQKIDSPGNSWGFALNSSFNTEVDAVGLVPSASYYKGKSQFELGVGFYPFVVNNQRIVSGNFNYKYFPNGADDKFNLFLMMSTAYVNQLRKTYYPATYQYLFLSGGYGMQIRLIKGAYLGTSINLGTFTHSKRTENPYKNYLGTQNLFDEFGMNLDFQVNVGYRF
ncbi:MULTISPECIES: hypothetical protein [unclassified Imperialibacter]|uniref:hypothetical protein n=1 Tax=unclassified Imperialibacter TaxID=2629706 RepID=UPI0012573462|nr:MULTISPECIES: hypothetical protein [unclassified Imperialibacter]CAD5254203.1 conserved hypothetical protein [Imperialibacter sp. 75]CAD5262638.1 conserved hypothetical protein [Imperialibacter sp. 89]VVT35288.1 conserved hypothetical protein [Imperialibacter sp. EC-SDR9]